MSFENNIYHSYFFAIIINYCLCHKKAASCQLLCFTVQTLLQTEPGNLPMLRILKYRLASSSWTSLILSFWQIQHKQCSTPLKYSYDVLNLIVIFRNLNSPKLNLNWTYIQRYSHIVQLFIISLNNLFIKCNIFLFDLKNTCPLNIKYVNLTRI